MQTQTKTKQRVALLGSTGSIGEQTLQVIRDHSSLFEVTTLTAHNNWQRLVEQALEFEPDSVVIANKDHYNNVVEALKNSDIKIYAGGDSVEQIVENENIDVVMSALVGFSGLFPTINSLKHSKRVALANKESLVVAGETVMQLSSKHNAAIIPVDSEHSAIFQSLVGEYSPIEKVIITASGGPLLDWKREAIANATVAQVLAHPNWVMGKKITVDSASMMNKGFEVIEAKWLFDLKPSQIEVVVHPSSVVHSMVQFEDGAVKAQMGTPDMRLPIQYALSFPLRLKMDPTNRLDFTKTMNLTFQKPDTNRFPCLRIAYEAMSAGGNAPCIVNAANEIAVAAFLNGEISFGKIPTIIENCVTKINYIPSPSLDDYRQTDTITRQLAITMTK